MPDEFSHHRSTDSPGSGHSHERSSDHAFLPAWLPDNLYRDIWLLTITIVLVLIAVKALNASSDARRAGSQAVNAVQTVQQSRLDLIRSSCKAQNTRNLNTVHALEFEISRLPRARERRRATRSERYTIALINTLAPKQDCAGLVAKARINH